MRPPSEAQPDERTRWHGSTRLFLVALALLDLLVATSASHAASPAADAAQPVIIELTAAPMTRARASASVAEAQRVRVRGLILALEGQARAARGRTAAPAADAIRFEYRVVANGFAATLLPETIAALAADPDVRRVVPDAPVHAILDVSVPHVRAPEVWSDFGYRGAGVTIAVIDTGVDYTHPDLGGCFGPGCKVVGGYDFDHDDADPQDDHGHGTHVAATAAGDGVLRGVAPDAQVLAYKVLNDRGNGLTSTVIAGVERATDPDHNGDPSDHATIISMSLGGFGDENDPGSAAVDAATAAGVLCVIAAGNNHGRFTIGSPGTARTALTVGATDDADLLATFSSRGPTLATALLKPEITAPGVDICAARLPGSWPDRLCLDGQHVSLSGTSMATPHVAGAAALLRGLYPSLSPAEAKAILQEAAVPLGLDATSGGAGRLDVRAAVDVRTALVPAPVNLGVDDGTEAIWTRTVTVTVHNLDAAPKSYTLTFDDTGLPAGVSASIVPDVISVPADASADVSVQVSVDNAQVPASNTPPYLYTGRLVASAPGETRAIAVSFAHQPRPTNDLCENAVDIGSGTYGGTVLATTATTSASDPVSKCGCANNGGSLWYRITPSESGTVEVDTTGSGYQTALSVYAGHCGALRSMVCDDVTTNFDSHVSFAAKAGTSYYVEVASLCGALSGILDLDVVVPGPRATIVTPYTDVFRTTEADLAGTGLTFTPDGSSYAACADFVRDYPTDPAGGTVLPLTWDSFLPIHLTDGATVPFGGQQYDTLFVGSNGYVTFTGGETEYGPALPAHFNVPTIAPFSARMRTGPQYLGSVSWKQLADRVAVTWDGIESAEGPLVTSLNDVQIELFFDGRIHMALVKTGTKGLTGLSFGTGAPTLFPTSNFGATPHCRAPAGGEVPLAGKQLTYRTKDTPTASKLKTVLGGLAAPALLPAPGSGGDPTLGGGAFELYNRRTGEFTSLPLPAAGWTMVTKSTGITYRYRDGDALYGPCSAVDVSARGVRTHCGRADLGFTLNEFQRELATSVTLGPPSTGTRFCSLFGGAVKKDNLGIFSAAKAPVPNRCWLPESYYP
jgi:subtilisin family serine protease